MNSAQAGNADALDELVAGSLPLVYNIVGRALDGHADVDDVVQEVMLRVVRHLTELRDPSAYRSWLAAITIRQLRDREQLRATALTRDAELGAVQDVPDPASDFTALTILRLGLTDQRREVAEASRWLDPDDRALLALWWLEETGHLDRDEVAAALGLSNRHAAVRVQRMKETLQIARSVVRAVRAQPGCRDLYHLTHGWDGMPTPLWRKRIARHVRECRQCGRAATGHLPVERLLAGLPMLPIPVGLSVDLPAAVQAAGHAAASAAGHAAASAAGPALGHAAGHAAASAAGPALGHAAASAAGPAAGHAAGPASAAGGSWLLGHLPWLRRLLAGGFHGANAAGPVTAFAAVSAVVAAGAIVAWQVSGPPKPTAAAAPAPSLSTPAPGRPAPVPTTSPSPATRSPATKAAVPPPPPPSTAAPSRKKGVSVWTFTGVDSALADSGATWYYTWSTTHAGVTTPAGTQFVPMIWGAKSVTASALAQAKAAGPDLLGFNEPDMSAQSNMSVEQALDLWPQLQSTGATLGSPAVAFGGDTAGGWLDRFMSGAAQRGYRVDFITLHWYGGDFVTSHAVNQLRSYIQAVHDRYHKPIWLTEYALINFTGASKFPSPDQQAAFVTASTRMLGGLSFVQRYAWFALPADDGSSGCGLYRAGPQITAVGQAFKQTR